MLVGGAGGEHLAVLVSGHGLGAPDVGLHRRGKRECSLLDTATAEGKDTGEPRRSAASDKQSTHKKNLAGLGEGVVAGGWQSKQAAEMNIIMVFVGVVIVSADDVCLPVKLLAPETRRPGQRQTSSCGSGDVWRGGVESISIEAASRRAHGGCGCVDTAAPAVCCPAAPIAPGVVATTATSGTVTGKRVKRGSSLTCSLARSLWGTDRQETAVGVGGWAYKPVVGRWDD
jgi:hypothetical protein